MSTMIQETQALSESDLNSLLRLARFTLAQLYRQPAANPGTMSKFNGVGASHVSLFHRGKLRSAKGTIDAHTSLAEDIVNNTVQAASWEPKPKSLHGAEYHDTRIRLDILSELEIVDFIDQDEAAEKLTPGIDGVILTRRNKRVTFLPDMWNTYPCPRRFLAELTRKAQIPSSTWDAHVLMQRYTVTTVVEAV